MEGGGGRSGRGVMGKEGKGWGGCCGGGGAHGGGGEEVLGG